MCGPPLRDIARRGIPEISVVVAQSHLVIACVTAIVWLFRRGQYVLLGTVAGCAGLLALVAQSTVRLPGTAGLPDVAPEARHAESAPRPDLTAMPDAGEAAEALLARLEWLVRRNADDAAIAAEVDAFLDISDVVRAVVNRGDDRGC